MRVKCIDDTTMSGLFKERTLTNGKIYVVIKEDNLHYTIIDDECLHFGNYLKKKFIKVED